MDKIFGCKKGTLTYFHEQGHQNWFRRGIETKLQAWMFMCLLLAVFSMSMDNKDLGFLLASTFVILYTIPEVHAWIFAFNKWKKKNDKT